MSNGRPRQWRTLRVVVQVAVQGPDFTEKKLVNAVASQLQRLPDNVPKWVTLGRVHVKQFSKAAAHALRTDAAAIGGITEELKRLEQRVRQLERDTSPHVLARMD